MNDQRAFTVNEVIIVVSILGILAAIAIPNFIAYQERKAKELPAEDTRTEEQKQQDEYRLKKTFTLDGCQGHQFYIMGEYEFVFSCPPGGNTIVVVP